MHISTRSKNKMYDAGKYIADMAILPNTAHSYRLRLILKISKAIRKTDNKVISDSIPFFTKVNRYLVPNKEPGLSNHRV